MYNTFSIRYGSIKSFYNEHSECLFLSSSFVFKSAYQTEFYFKYFSLYNIYSRFSNPNLTMLKKRLSNLEFVKYAITTSSGMSAIVSVFLVFLKPGDFFLSSKNLFGSTFNFFSIILYKFNIIVRFFNYFNINLCLKFICIFTKLIYIESPSNPLMDIIDIKNVSYISNRYKLIFVVDNTYSTPVNQNPIVLGCDIVIHSCTKFFDGQGRVLGGIILSNNNIIFNKINNFIRIVGFNLSIFNSWIIFKSLETLIIRIKKKLKNTLILIDLLRINKFILNILYFNSFNRFNVLKYQQISNGSIFSFFVKGFTFELHRILVWKIINNLKFISITANLGDVKTIITIPSITTHYSLSFFEKVLLGINESLVRVSVGLEDVYDIYNDLINSLNYQ